MSELCFCRPGKRPWQTPDWHPFWTSWRFNQQSNARGVGSVFGVWNTKIAEQVSTKPERPWGQWQGVEVDCVDRDLDKICYSIYMLTQSVRSRNGNQWGFDTQSRLHGSHRALMPWEYAHLKLLPFNHLTSCNVSSKILRGSEGKADKAIETGDNRNGEQHVDVDLAWEATLTMPIVIY